MGLLSSCEKAGWLFGANKPPEGVICRMLSRLATNVAISRTFLKRRVHMLEQANRGLRQRSRRHPPEIIREQFGITQFVAHYCVIRLHAPVLAAGVGSFLAPTQKSRTFNLEMEAYNEETKPAREYTSEDDFSDLDCVYSYLRNWAAKVNLNPKPAMPRDTGVGSEGPWNPGIRSELGS
jgi:hypothetical protein